MQELKVSGLYVVKDESGSLYERYKFGKINTQLQDRPIYSQPINMQRIQSIIIGHDNSEYKLQVSICTTVTKYIVI